MTSPNYSDIGTWLAQAALDAVQEAIRSAGIDPPATVEIVHGTGVPLTDVSCDGGLLWARVGTAYPSDGSGGQFAEARVDFSLPAWVTAIEVGLLNCRSNIDEDGYAPDADEETEYAQRDGNYRMAMLDGLGGYFPDKIRPCALGMVLEPWAPIGPDGAVSGGIVVVRVITTGLAVAPGGPCA